MNLIYEEPTKHAINFKTCSEVLDSSSKLNQHSRRPTSIVENMIIIRSTSNKNT